MPQRPAATRLDRGGHIVHRRVAAAGRDDVGAGVGETSASARPIRWFAPTTTAVRP